MSALILSFDTEDFVTPESDDALLMLARELSKRGLRGCFALVGDKLRALLQRGRSDVLDALRDHEIDYHSNDHHFFPLQAPQLEGQPWESSLAWMLQHEAPGLDLIEQVFGTHPVAYLKADSHWTPQLLAAYRRLGLQVYSSRHFAAGDPALYRYMNLLCLPYTQMLDSFIKAPGTPQELVRATLADLHQRSSAAGEDGVVTYGTHPCMWCCDSFYDMHNIRRRGKPPAREKWGPAPLLPPEQIRRNRRFWPALLEALVSDGVRVTTYQEVAAAAMPGTAWLTAAQLGQLARQTLGRFAAGSTGGRAYNCAEILTALCQALTSYEQAGLPARVPVLRPLGPVQTPRVMAEPLPVCSRALQGAARKLWAHVLQTGMLPAGVDVGGHHFAPAQLLRAAAQGYLRALEGKGPSCEPLQPMPDCPQEQELLSGARIGAWALPADYRPESLLELGRLQSWTLAAP